MIWLQRRLLGGEDSSYRSGGQRHVLPQPLRRGGGRREAEVAEHVVRWCPYVLLQQDGRHGLKQGLLLRTQEGMRSAHRP